MRRILIGFILLFALSGVTKSHAASFDFLEEFAISSDRSAVLKRLIPGTRDYYYYYALHYQVQGKLKKVDALLKRWESRYRYDSRRKSIKHRQALLRYATNPKSSLSYLLKALNIRLNHFRTVATQKPNYPTFLDPKRIGWKTLSKKAMAGIRYNLYRFTDDALFWLLRQNLSGSLRRRLLRRLKHPAFPGLVAMIAADLSYKYSGGFGSLTVHRKLILA